MIHGGKLEALDQATLVKEALVAIEVRMAEHQAAFETLKGKPSMAALLKACAHFTAIRN